MRGRPPKKTLTPEQERAASAFVEAAESPGSGSGRSERATPTPGALPRTESPSRTRVSRDDGVRPWEREGVREDVVKGYALRLPEPLYLKLKWVAKQTGRSVNAVIHELVTAEVEAFLDQHDG
ncbi:hypothetical protein [Rubrivirga sp.]|uniref:hypothetical protein n=1 Tax=Rubrivirga sp. TaxID=1885344 RepID=UPI003C758395